MAFSTGQQQFVGRQLLLAHSGSRDGRTLADRKMATIMVVAAAGPLPEERGNLEESSQSEKAEGRFCISFERSEDRSNEMVDSGRKTKKRKRETD